MAFQRKDVAPRTKDGRHEIVFGTNFVANHSLPLRAALEGRVTLELFSIARTDPKRARDINAHYSFFCEREFPIDDPHGVLSNISIPYMGNIVASGETKEGDDFTPPYIPLERSLEPFQSDSFNFSIKGGYFCSFLGRQSAYERDTMYVPDLEQFESSKLFTHARFDELRSRVNSLSGTFEDVLGYDDLVKMIEDVSRFHIFRALAQSKYALNNLERFECANARSSEFVYTRVLASPSLKEKVAKAAIALCEEYISETVE